MLPPARRIAAIACLLVASGLVAQTMTEFRLRPEESDTDFALTEKILYRRHDLDDRGFNRAVSSITVPTVMLYQPAHVAHRGAAVVICPGGGYEYLAIDRGGHALARYFQHQGIIAVVLKYRLPIPPLASGAAPLSQQDALAAVQFVRRHAPAWGIDERRIGILGSSAGGHLAASAAIFGREDEGSRPDFVVLLSPVVTLAGPLAHAGSRDRLLGPNPPPEQVETFSLERQARSGLPPFFVTHANDDSVVPVENSQLLVRALEKNHVPVELLLVAAGGHGFSGSDLPAAAAWKKRFLEWLDALP